MQFQFIVPALAAIFSLTSLVQGRPILCSDSKRDAILSGKLNPEECCSYGTCKGDVVISSA